EVVGHQTQGASILFEAPEDPLLVALDHARLSLAFAELLAVALKEVPRGGQLLVQVLEDPSPLDPGEPGYACVILDPGEGAWRPPSSSFVLSLAWEIVRDHGGWIEVEREGRARRYCIFLPRVPA